jgi:hypothetical protein
MSYYNGPTIVTNGLVLYLDAANNKSYPGSGTSWGDLTGNSNTNTLTNGPTFNSANGGSIVFDGTNDEVAINSSTIARIGTSNHTISVFVNNDITSEEDLFGTGGIGVGDVLLMIYLAKFRGHAWSSTGNSNVFDSPNTIGTGGWNMLTQRVTWGANMDLFENGIKAGTKVLSGNAPSSTQNTAYLGARYPGTGPSHLQGKIGLVTVYNRALTDSEVLQNYNAIKTRFGL